MRNIIQKIPRIAKETILTAMSSIMRPFIAIDDKKVIFRTEGSGGYKCNPKYIAEALHDLDPSLDLVWVTSLDAENNFPSYIRTVKQRSVQSIYEYLSSRIWIDNARSRRCVHKRDDQFYIQTWHSYMSIKKVEQDALDSLSPRYVKQAQRDGAETDLMFADNDFRENLYSKSFWYNGPILRCGVPRNKPFFEDRDEYSSKVHNQLGIPLDKKICLYAPTFRKKAETSGVGFIDAEKVCEALENKFGGEYVFALRTHSGTQDETELSKNTDVVNATDYPDAQELLSAADVMISDYSSILDDFALTGRPAFVYAPDFDEYISQDRGLYYSPEIRPFPVSKSFNDLLSSIADYSEIECREKRESFFKLIGLDERGDGDRQVAKFILDVIEKRSSNG